eukprot:10556641-Alexandrium_andersonii.AAC.1
MASGSPLDACSGACWRLPALSALSSMRALPKSAWNYQQVHHAWLRAFGWFAAGGEAPPHQLQAAANRAAPN